MKNLRIELNWAVIFIIAQLVWVALERLAGLHDTYIAKHAVFTNLFILVAITIYALALLDKRKNYYGGHMSYKQGFISGLYITAIVTLLSPLSQVVVSMVISPAYFENAINYAVQSNQMSREEAEAYFSLSSYIIQGLIFAPIAGVFTSALVSFFVKKK